MLDRIMDLLNSSKQGKGFGMGSSGLLGGKSGKSGKKFGPEKIISQALRHIMKRFR